MFSVDDIVWAKSSVAREIFWPARVIESDSELEDNYQKKKPTVAYVNFLSEEFFITFEAIKNASNVQPFNCDRKEVFLKKGRNLKKQGKRLQFESAVKEAERCIKLYGKRKSTPIKHSLDTKKEASSPRTRRRGLLDQDKLSVATTSILNRSEMKPSPQAKTKCSLPIILEESSEILASNASTSTVRNQIDNCKGKIVKKRGRKRKNIEVDFKNKDNFKQLGKLELSHRKDKNESDFGLKEAENELNCLKVGDFEGSCEKCGFRKSVLSVCSGNEVSDDKNCVAEERENKCESTTACLVSSRHRTRERTRSNSLNEPTTSRTSPKIDSKLENGCNSSLQSNSVKKATTKATCQNCLGKDSTAFRKETKRLRITLCEEGRENEAPLSNEKSGLKKQNSSRQNRTMDVSENLFSKNNENRKAAHSSTKTKQSLNAVVNCLESLNAPSCRNANGLGHSELDSLQPRVSCGDSGLACDKTAEMLRCDENEKKFESFVGKAESADVKDNESDVQDNAKYDCRCDDDPLPEAFSLSPGTKKNFRPGDVVWVKHWRNPFWPAQIGREAHKKTHFYVKFLPKSDCRCIKVRKKNIKTFTEDHETFLRYKNQEVNPSLHKEFEEAVKQAEEILVRRVFQKDDILLDDVEDQVSDLSDDDGPSSPCNDKQDKPVFEADKPDEKPEDGESGFDSSEIENLEMAENGRSPRKRKNANGHSELDSLQPKVICDNSGLACDKTAEMLRCDENEKKFEGFVGKGESADVKDNESDVQDNAEYDCRCDDDPLLKAFSLSPGTKKNFRPGDVVWVKHWRNPFWPAQIGREAHKKTHFYVKFLPKSNCRCIKVPKKNIKTFTEDHETFLRYKNQEVNPSLHKEFEEAVKQAEEILVRRVFQKDDILLDDVEDQVSDLSDDDGPSSPCNDKQDKPVFEADKPDEKPEDGESGFDSSEIENLEMAENGRSPRKRKNANGHSELDSLQPKVICDNSGLACDKTAEMLRCDENEKKFEGFVGKGESADVKDNESDVQDNAEYDCRCDDDPLPEAFSLSPGTKKNFRPGDVVWVKHWRNPFWPAQIGREAHKKTHFYVKFLPKSDCRCIKVPKKNIKTFTEDHETFLRYKNQEVNPSLHEEFEEAVKQAEEILVRGVFQKDDILLDDVEDQVSDLSDDDGPSSPSNDKQDKPVFEADKPDEKPEDGECGFDSSEIEDLEIARNGRSLRKRK